MRTKKPPLTHEMTDAQLAEVFALQAAWKDGPMRRMVCVIIREALKKDGAGIWPDEPAIADEVARLSPDDKNCVGTAWRWTLKLGLLDRGKERRRSTAGSTRGREIAHWTVAKRGACEAFLRRNGAAFEAAQRELF